MTTRTTLEQLGEVLATLGQLHDETERIVQMADLHKEGCGENTGWICHMALLQVGETKRVLEQIIKGMADENNTD